MEHERPRWRIRISTLMLPVVIAALASALVADRWKRLETAQRAETAARWAVQEAERAQALAAEEAQLRAELDEAKRSVPRRD